MLEEIKKELKERIIPFWMGLKDCEYGGYYGWMDYDLTIDPKASKGCILNSRILWFFSRAYLELGDPKLLESAKHAYLFLKDHCVDKVYEGVFWSLSYDGKPLDTTKHTYNQAFAIYALAAYYQASNDASALELAKDLFWVIEKNCRDKNGYLEAFQQDFKPESNEKLSENGVIADRTMNTALHVLEAYTLLYQVTNDELVEQKLIELLLVFNEKIYDAGKKRLEVFFDQNYCSLLDLHSYGHDIEASWLLDLAIETIGENVFAKGIRDELKAMTLTLAQHTFELAFDGDSFANECENGVVKENRIWWVQAEAMVGFVNAYQKTLDEKFIQATEHLWKYIKEYIIDHRNGSEWLWEVYPDGTPVRRAIVEPWKCPYHNGRMCLELMRRMEQLERGK
ncbi:AGE family epimerase/isomerase [Agathobacter ruminis]|uniref:Cellobiose 2-epimerase n=1 Tax=Agathobacter ruminis TaxID=1712665 RepID=A0A2G3E1G0_9FIRM|nr:AGE family epimerase/isomerase [Agathobacter ruminis]MDC7300389.1 AGE family epimerase/isomerase [Agathobacter ruminis]PHU37112.1 N-acylglucosamine 2-epimerase [Agathobacter ruminis]